MPAKNQKESPPPEETHVEVTDVLDAELESLLQTEPLQGLTTEDAIGRLERFGPNGMQLVFKLWLMTI